MPLIADEAPLLLLILVVAGDEVVAEAVERDKLPDPVAGLVAEEPVPEAADDLSVAVDPCEVDDPATSDITTNLSRVMKEPTVSSIDMV